MADSKYADLPGIAYNQADVYETIDLPQTEIFHSSTEDETEAIERLHLSPSEAFDNFKGKRLTSTGIDFSDRISLKSRTGFGIWEAPQKEHQETSVQKYNRLQYEIEELQEEINHIKEDGKRDGELKNVVDIMAKVNEAGKQLSTLKIENRSHTDLLTTFYDPQRIQLKQLESRIEQFKHIRRTKSAEGEKKKSESVTKTGVLQYEMMYFPEKYKMQEFTRIVQLEQRLSRLEAVLGVSDDGLTKLAPTIKSQGLLESVRKLAAKAASLDSNQVDVMESRIATLLYRMDAFAQKKLDMPADSERDQKIIEMFEILKKTEDVALVVPRAVQRMIALHSIHRQAGQFRSSLAKLEEFQFQISNSLQENELVLKSIQQSFANNMGMIHNNMAAFEQRIHNLIYA